MTSSEFRAILERLGWSQTRAHRVLGFSLRTVAGWCAEPQRSAIPKGIADVLRWWRQNPYIAHHFEEYQILRDKLNKP